MLNIGEYVRVISSGYFGVVVGFNEYGMRGKEKYMYKVAPIGGKSSHPFKRDELLYINPVDLIDIALINRNKEEFDLLLKQFGKDLFQDGGTRK